MNAEIIPIGSHTRSDMRKEGRDVAQLKPFVGHGERILPAAARDFADRVHSGQESGVLYRVYDSFASATAAAFRCRQLPVFEGLNLDFEARHTARGAAVYGVQAGTLGPLKTRRPGGGRKPRERAAS